MPSSTSAVCAPHYRATQAGSRILAAGGSAVDAAIAASAVLCVVYPNMVTLGGDSWTLVAKDGEDARAVDGTGRAPAALSAQYLRDAGYTSVPQQGPHSITVPGGVAAWGIMHREYGRLPLGELFADAIELAENSATIASSLARDILTNRAVLAQDPGCAALFFADGEPKREGDPLLQPALANTLRLIAEKGTQELYLGDLGRRYAEGLNRLGSVITPEDLAGHESEFVEPISAGYRDVEILSAPPSSQGFMLLQLLMAADRAGAGWTDNEALRWMPRVVRAFGDERDRHLGDPDRMALKAAALLDDAFVDGIVARAEDDTAPAPRSHSPLTGDTAAIVSTDDDGLAVSMIQSVCGAFGSALLEESTGIVAHNRGSYFRLDEGAVDSLLPGTKPPHTLMPALVRKERATIVTAGTMGGKNQPVILAQVISRILDGESAQSAVDAPRWVVPAAAGDEPAVVEIEEGMPAAQRTFLEESGLPAIFVPRVENHLGQAQAIVMRPGSHDTGTDSRADGLVPA